MFTLTNRNTFQTVESIVEIMDGLPHHSKWNIKIYADAYDEMEFVLRPRIAKSYSAIYLCDPCVEAYLKNVLIQRPYCLVSLEPTTKIECASSTVMIKHGMKEE